MKKLVYLLLFVSVGILAQTTTENYVKNTTYKVITKDGITKFGAGTLTNEEKQVSISYFDGLGRAKQSVALGVGGNKEDIITHFEYDAFGRQVKEFLPFAYGSYNLNIRDENLGNLTSLENYTNNFYKNKFPDDFLNVALPDVNAYSEKHFENSPLNRVLEQGAPGKDWKVNKTSDSDHTIKFHYGTNSSNEVLLFEVVFENGNTQTPKLKLPDSYYNAGELYKTITMDENWRTYDGKDKTTEEFKNKQGQVVLKRTYNNQQPHDTHYVYDDFGNLTYVLPPLASEKAIIYDLTTFNIPVSNLVVGGNPTGNISFGIVKTGVNTYQFVGDINLHNLGNSSFIDGVIMNIPNLPASLGSYISLGSIYQYDYIDDIEYERSVSYYISNGKLYCSSYSYSYNYNTDEYSDDVSEAGFPDITEFDETKTIGLTNTLEGITEAETQVQVNAILDKLCYQYKYDYRNRLIEKRIPGKELEYIIYDPLDRPILTQDANLRSSNKWLFTKYDVFGRVVYTGIYTHNTPLNQQQMQSHYNNASAQGGGIKLYYENKSPSEFGSSYVQHHYTNLMFPFSNIEILTVNYYDDYVFNRLGMGTSITTYSPNPITSTANTKGLATGTKVKVLDEIPEKWITTINYYDHKARPIYVYSNNAYLNTIDIVESKLDDFTGKVLETKTTHKKTGKNDIITIDKFEYDHTDRLLKQKQTINGQPEELIVKNTYDELGQLKIKKIGDIENNELQQIDFDYNIRGWLTNINDPQQSLGNDLFSMELKYNDDGTRLYNGNISKIYWKTSGDYARREYNYYYDDLNRITSAYYNSWNQSGKFSLNSVNYDKNGNIQGLQRQGAIVENPDAHNHSHYGTMDNLSYTYNGNKLINVNDSSNDTYGFKDVNNAANVEEYLYDQNGNMTKDINKGIINITYNHLNLPKQVTFSQGNIQYKYDATGVKQRRIVTSTSGTTTTDYAGNYIYENSLLQFFNTTEGYVTPVNSSNYTLGFKYVYQYKDHLGNVRLSFKENENATQTTTIFTDSFENISNWDNSANSFGWGITAIDTSKSKTGSTSGRIDPNYPSDWEKYVFSDTWTPINNTVDTYYTVSAWVFVEDVANNDAQIFLSGREAGETGYPSKNYSSTLTTQRGQWVYLEHSVLVPKEVKQLNIRIDNNKEGKVWFDDVKIVKGNTSRTIVIEESNYYPFGLKHKGYNEIYNTGAGNPTAQKWKYNGVEYNESLGLNLYEMDVRMYDPAIARFNGIDPVTHFSQGTSVAFDNNPIYWADPSGMDSFQDLVNQMNPGVNYVSNGDGTFTGGNHTIGTKTDPKEGETRPERLGSPSGVGSYLTGRKQYYHSHGKFSGWVSEDTYNKYLDNIALEILNENPSADTMSWLSKIDDSVIDNLANRTDIVIDRILNLQAAAVHFDKTGQINAMNFSSPFFLPGLAAKLMSGGTKVSQFAFWSGRGTQQAALDAGFKVLGNTKAGLNLAALTANMEYRVGSQAWHFWGRLSQAFARRIPKGSTVNVFVTRGNNANPMSIWSRFERPILEANKVKIKYNFID